MCGRSSSTPDFSLLTRTLCPQALIAVAAQPKDPATAKKVTVLIGEVLQLANRVLPPVYATRVQVSTRHFSSDRAKTADQLPTPTGSPSLIRPRVVV